jgi:hypothetical protein
LSRVSWNLAVPRLKLLGAGGRRRQVTDACYQRHTHAEFLDSLKKVAKAHPRVKLHIAADNYAIHKHANVKAWLQADPRVISWKPC